jgi:1-hydroxycarotenoid 3,4-desaturase
LAERRVVVVGAGVGGLAAAIDLARAGLTVTVLERAPAPGGKLRRVPAGGVLIDSGPTVFTMRWVFEELFDDAGASLASQLRLTPLSVLARHAWGQGGQLDLFADPARSAEAIGEFSDAQEARRFLAFCAQAREVYRALEGPYIRSPRPTPLGLARDLGPRGLATLAALRPFSSLWRALGRHFRDPRLRQLFGRYATYCGGSPFLAPATLMLVAQVEMDGVWAIEGGMGELAQALASLARLQGASIRCDTEVAEIIIEQGRARGVLLAGGERIDADAVVFNGDVSALADGLLGPSSRGAARPVPMPARSLSALTWSIHAPTAGFPLLHHNVFFDEDYASEFADVFGHARLPARPTVYVCAQDRLDEAHAPAAERLLCLVNAPASGDRHGFGRDEVDGCARRAFGLLERCGLSVARDAGTSVVTTPADFERLFPATGGALYGRASHGWMLPFVRSGSASKLPGLWLAGGSVHPGPGVPMATLSGRLAARSLLESLGIQRSRL